MLVGRVGAGTVALIACACDSPATQVIFENDYATTSANVVYEARWEATTLAAPLAPGESSDPQSSVFASSNAAYVVLAPGWDPSSGAAPTSFVVLESRAGYALDFDDTLRISVDDASFAGNCATGSMLSQDDADFLTQRVFAQTFTGLHYDASTCTTTPSP